MRVLSLTLMLCGMFIVFLGGFMGASYFSKNRPTQPRPQTGQTVSFNNHGTVTYISRRDDFIYNFGCLTGILIGFLGASIHVRHSSGRRNRA